MKGGGKGDGVDLVGVVEWSQYSLSVSTCSDMVVPLATPLFFCFMALVFIV